jgi:hypothetical protein
MADAILFNQTTDPASFIACNTSYALLYLQHRKKYSCLWLQPLKCNSHIAKFLVRPILNDTALIRDAHLLGVN